MIYIKIKKGGIKMLPLKKAKYNKPEDIATNYKEKICNGVPKRVYINLKENKNKKLV